ncbi:MAG: hypothetical protein GY754_11070 [bacterium]|nr:hypothetical protein [bacterium]
MNKKRNIMGIFISVLLLLSLPLLGILLQEKPLAPFLQFPPLTDFIQQPGFSWTAFFIFTVIIIIPIIPFIVMFIRYRKDPGYVSPKRHPFPWWGWAGLLLSIVAWILSWTRIELIAPFQVYLYSPLWFGFIILLNALTQMRSGSCMLKDRTVYFLLLFPLSSLYWWFFEFLNRFIQNWHYLGVNHLTPLAYTIAATIAFSTVLPGVLGAADLLATFPRFKNAFTKGITVPLPFPRATAIVLLLAASTSLILIGIWPQFLFPLAWVSPLLIVLSVQTLLGKDTIITPLTQGNWQRFGLLIFAALMCGFFWELWNFYSVAKWVYTVPFVHRFLIFEMPILGFAGYLPFGLECGAVGSWISGE